MRKILSILFCLPLIGQVNGQNVGVGTSSPLMPLHVSSGDSTTLLLENRQSLTNDRGTALYFKTGNYYTGAIKTTGQGSNVASLGLYTFAVTNPNSLLERLTIVDNGNVGIGTDPAYKLDVNGRIRIRYNANTAGLWLNKADNSAEATFLGNVNDSIFGIYGSSWRFYFNHLNGNLGIGISNPRVDLSFPATIGKKISLYPGGTGDVGMGVYGNEFRIHSDVVNADITFGYDNYTNGFTERMRVKGDGRVCIGTTSPANGYLLSVDGKIISEEVRVQFKGSWPDYVFKKDYKLMGLSLLEKYIHENNHLPGFDKAEVIEKNGADLGETQRKLLEKVEELTLHLIDLNKRIDRLEKENSILKSSNRK